MCSRNTWNVVYITQSNKSQPPTSRNIAPAMRSNTPKYDRKQLKHAETSFTLRSRSETVPSMIRAWTRQSATRPSTEVTFRIFSRSPCAFSMQKYNIRALAIIPNLTKYFACREKWHLNCGKYCTCHKRWHLNFTKHCTCHENSTSFFDSIILCLHSTILWF